MITQFKASNSPLFYFFSNFYQRHNQKRLKYLASLNLSISHSTVLEVGADVGDHTGFLLNQSCEVTSVEARPENLEILRLRYPTVAPMRLDVDSLDFSFNQQLDIVYCYGLLYHLKYLTEAIEFMFRCCHKLRLLETCVTFGDGESVNLRDELVENPTQSYSGQGCRPTRLWVYN